MAERPVSKDYRSFAANVFGTVAFKMLEWLTPAGLEAMSEKVAALEADAAQGPSRDDAQRSQKPSGQSTPMQPIPPIVYADKPSSDLPQPTTDQGPDAVLDQASQKLHAQEKLKRQGESQLEANSKAFHRAIPSVILIRGRHLRVGFSQSVPRKAAEAV
ncbi:HECT-domain-containing protein [Colletotrichum higginsianum]|nr:HECT-domain-containing protein [Colletotrichum higginsianum]